MARILVTKLGLDGHDVGVKVLAAAARDAGHDVIYLGIRQTVESVTRAALDEDVDLVAVSLLSGAHNTLLPALVDTLRYHGSTVPVVVGGMIPESDKAGLLESGVSAVVSGGVSGGEAVSIMTDIVDGDVPTAVGR